MAIRSNFELIDFLSNERDLSIHAIDKDGILQNVITTENAVQYFKHKYGTRFYPVLRGVTVPTLDDALSDFADDFRLWVSNRQHNIDRQYQALFDYDYSPIENVDRYETETGITNYGKTNTESGSETTTYGKTETVTYGKEDTRTISDDVKKTGTETQGKGGSEIHETEKAGYNSPNGYANDVKVTDSFSNRSDETVYNTDTATTTSDRNVESGRDTQATTGTDGITTSNTSRDSGSDSNSRTLRVHGNIGVTRSDELVGYEIDLRKLSLAEMLLDNFINDYTYYS